MIWIFLQNFIWVSVSNLIQISAETPPDQEILLTYLGHRVKKLNKSGEEEGRRENHRGEKQPYSISVDDLASS